MDRSLSYSEDLHYFVAEVVDDLYGDTARFRFGKGARDVAMERGPGFLVDLGFKGGSERAVWIIRTQEVGMADEETFFVVVGIDEPAGDAFGVVAANFTRLWVKHIHTVDPDPDLAVFLCQESDVWLSEDDEEKIGRAHV